MAKRLKEKGGQDRSRQSHSNYKEGPGPFSKNFLVKMFLSVKREPGRTSKKKKVEKMMFKREELLIYSSRRPCVNLILLIFYHKKLRQALEAMTVALANRDT
ncbi:hypothetical protein KY290_010316 [Solanum tuberosum]|uniref:Uncharacterized protein n=1 Tax=Solanum tuberosum TaxID=4113 RepID=A0ABQ7VXI6_SOLTU|nr:hypothetical protein KY290_010316 [Solanum tuberosum]